MDAQEKANLEDELMEQAISVREAGRRFDGLLATLEHHRAEVVHLSQV